MSTEDEADLMSDNVQCGLNRRDEGNNLPGRPRRPTIRAPSTLTVPEGKQMRQRQDKTEPRTLIPRCFPETWPLFPFYPFPPDASRMGWRLKPRTLWSRPRSGLRRRINDCTNRSARLETILYACLLTHLALQLFLSQAVGVVGL